MSPHQKKSTKIFFNSVCTCLIASTVFVLISTLFNQSAQAQSRRVRYVPPENLDAPKASASGISRSGCTDKEKICLIALFPDLKVETSPVPQTTLQRPTIYLLTPPVENGVFFFRIFEENDLTSKRIYRNKFEINNQAGIIAFKIPDDAPVLEVNKKYKLQFDIEYKTDDSKTVYGYIKRVLPSPKLVDQLKNTTKPIEIAALYAREGLWFETMQTLAEAQLTLPLNPEITEEWLELLKSAKINRALSFAFVGQIPKQIPKQEIETKTINIAPKPIDALPNSY